MKSLYIIHTQTTTLNINRVGETGSIMLSCLCDKRFDTYDSGNSLTALLLLHLVLFLLTIRNNNRLYCCRIDIVSYVPFRRRSNRHSPADKSD